MTRRRLTRAEIIFYGAFIVMGIVALVPAIMALRLDSYDVAAGREVRAPAATVWRYVTEPAARRRWESGLYDAILMKGDAGVEGAGSLLIVKHGDRRQEVGENLVRAVPHTLLVFERRTESWTETVEWTFGPAPGDGATKVSVRVRRHYELFVDKYRVLWFGRERQTALDRMLRRLDEVVEE